MSVVVVDGGKLVGLGKLGKLGRLGKLSKYKLD